MSKTKKKVFLSNEDLRENDEQNKQKAKEKRAKISEKFKETNNGTIKFTTPKFEIVEINKSTDNVPDAKVGDVIYGEMTVLENGENWYILKFDYLTVENNAPDARYVLCKSYTDRKSRRFHALASKIEPIDTYYFINSSGEIHLAEAGNAKSDNFRTKSGNVFATKEDAEKRLDYILSGK